MRPATPRKNLTTSILNDLGVAIVTGAYGKGNPFPVEAELCAQFGASRVIVREAVKMLTAKGLLQSRARHGTWVQSEDEWNFFDPDVLRWMLERRFSFGLLIQFTELRLAVEPAAAALAARVATKQARAAITAAIARMQAADRGEDDTLESDIEFHTAVLAASGNPFFAKLRQFIHVALLFSIQRTNALKGVPRANVADHGAVASAIMARKPERAEAAMRELIEEALFLIRREERKRSRTKKS